MGAGGGGGGGILIYVKEGIPSRELKMTPIVENPGRNLS